MEARVKEEFDSHEVEQVVEQTTARVVRHPHFRQLISDLEESRPAPEVFPDLVDKFADEVREDLQRELTLRSFPEDDGRELMAVFLASAIVSRALSSNARIDDLSFHVSIELTQPSRSRLFTMLFMPKYRKARRERKNAIRARIFEFDPGDDAQVADTEAFVSRLNSATNHLSRNLNRPAH